MVGGNLVFIDNCPKHPSVYLNMYIAKLNKTATTIQNLNIILIKDKVLPKNKIYLANSYYCEVVIGEHAQSNDFTFIESNTTVVDLKEQLDTKIIVENAADLNLKLMKWRMAPSL